MSPTRDIWTRVAIDPAADRLTRWIAPRRAITPDRITAVAGLLGLAAAVCLSTGHLRLGGVLFLLRFFADCLDGKVARAQAASSHRGALLDVTTDVLGVTAAYAALSWWAVQHHRIDPALALALLGALGTYGWALAHRKHLAESAREGAGSARFPERTGVRPVDWWLHLCRRAGMRPVPWAVEVETLVLGLLPVISPEKAAAGIPLALGFYVTATLVNVRRSWRLAGRLDQAARTDAAAREGAT